MDPDDATPPYKPRTTGLRLKTASLIAMIHLTSSWGAKKTAERKHLGILEKHFAYKNQLHIPCGVRPWNTRDLKEKPNSSALRKSVVTPPAWRRNKGVQCFLWRSGTAPPHGGKRAEMLGESEKQSCFLENRTPAGRKQRNNCGR